MADSSPEFPILSASTSSVPREVMNETYSTNNTARIAFLIKLKLREYGLAFEGIAG